MTRHRQRIPTLAVAVVALMAIPALPARSQARQSPAVGVFFGIVSERARFAGRTVDGLEEESGRIGVHLGRWSIGYSGKRFADGVIRLTPGVPQTQSELHVQGIDVGRAFRRTARLQPTAHLLAGTATIIVTTRASLEERGTRATASTAVVEPAIGLSLPIWKVTRTDLRAGFRFAAAVRVGDERYTTTSFFVSASQLFGWLGDWRKH